jgi:hypothetical protein
MSTLLIKQLVTSFFIMPRSRAYTGRVRQHRRRPPGSFRRRHVGPADGGAHILDQSDLARYIPLLARNGMSPSTNFHFEQRGIVIPELTSHEFGTGTLSCDFDIPPAPDDCVLSQLTFVVFETLQISWPDQANGHMEFGVIKAANNNLSRTLFRMATAWAGSVTGSYFVWSYDGKICARFVGSQQSTSFISYDYVGFAGSWSNVIGIQCARLS